MEFHFQAQHATLVSTDPSSPVLVIPGTKKTDPRPSGARVQGIVLHYTAIRAAARPTADLAKFSAHTSPAVVKFVSDKGKIPPGLALCLQNMVSDRKASWDFLIDRDGVTYQCSTRLATHKSWHAGRKPAGMPAHDVKLGGVLVWDAAAKKFHYPLLPDGSVMVSGNDATVGIELDCWGPIHRDHAGQWRAGRRSVDGKPAARVQVSTNDVVKIGKYHYERLTDAQRRSLIALAAALRDAFAIPRNGWYRHSDIRPDKKLDPEPPLDVAALLADLYDGPQVAEQYAPEDFAPEDADGEPDDADSD